ncbi:hypothetical protein B0H10DRAFT_778885 [Mycena sp. CBHHK59/15]|nr:hypothetical protein B0H10DRAFT_778885 [Mycena sp. CBHHK59/15]
MAEGPAIGTRRRMRHPVIVSSCDEAPPKTSSARTRVRRRKETRGKKRTIIVETTSDSDEYRPGPQPSAKTKVPPKPPRAAPSPKPAPSSKPAPPKQRPSKPQPPPAAGPSKPQPPPTSGPSKPRTDPPPPRPTPRPSFRGTPGYRGTGRGNFGGRFTTTAQPNNANPRPSSGLARELWDAEALIGMTWSDMIQRLLVRFPHPVVTRRPDYQVLQLLSPRLQHQRLSLVYHPDQNVLQDADWRTVTAILARILNDKRPTKFK